MHNKFPHLFKPIKIGPYTLKNRIISAPNSLPSITADGHLGAEEIAFFELKAKGGASIVTVGESIVHTKTGKSHNHQIQLDDPNVVPSLANCAKAIKRYGALANIELSHGGKYAGISSVGGDNSVEKIAYGPSDEVTALGEKVYEMPREVIYEIIEAYCKAAKTVKRAGFDMLMFHAAHGWLFNQFLSPKYNKRTDEFGGSLENRARFFLLALDAVREEVGPYFPIELRINGDDFVEGGTTLEEYIEICRMADNKVDLFNISCGDHEEAVMYCRTHPSVFLDHGCNVYLSTEIKKHVETPVACVGGIGDPEMCEEIIASGKADLIEIGRGLVADPYFPRKAQFGQEDDITPCLRCYVCNYETFTTETIKCAVNPVIGNELDEKSCHEPPEKIKNVLVIGGGPGGMQAAVTAAGRGHNVTICEKSGSFGGMLKSAGAAEFKKDIRKLGEVMENRVIRSGTKILLNTEATPELVGKLQPDAIIVAVGAKPVVPPIPGIQSDKVIMAADAEKHATALGEKVIVLGGGLVGCEIAVQLAQLGKNAVVVEMMDRLAPDANMWYRAALIDQMEKYGVSVYKKTRGKEINEKGLICAGDDGKEFMLEADNIVCAVGMRACTDVADSFLELAPEVYFAGDCIRPRQLNEAITEGHYIAKNL